jgi:cyanophycinase-like exopeptidase
MGLQDFGLQLRNPDFVKLAEVRSTVHRQGVVLCSGTSAACDIMHHVCIATCHCRHMAQPVTEFRPRMSWRAC